MALILSEINQIEEFFYTEVQKDFPIDLINLRERLRVITDTQQFKDEDEYIWKQKKGLIAKYYQIYFDDEFICGFDAYFPPEAIKLLFFRNLKQAIEQDKVIIDKTKKMIIEAQKAEAKRQKDFKDEVQVSKIEDYTTREIVKNLKKRDSAKRVLKN